jgi:hypothetical protein
MFICYYATHQITKQWSSSCFCCCRWSTRDKLHLIFYWQKSFFPFSYFFHTDFLFVLSNFKDFNLLLEASLWMQYDQRRMWGTPPPPSTPHLSSQAVVGGIICTMYNDIHRNKLKEKIIIKEKQIANVHIGTVCHFGIKESQHQC